MNFLKDILGEELFNQVAEKINAHNGNEANKDNQIKIGNLGSGEYVGKGKYEAEVLASQGKDDEIANYKKAIADLQKANKGNEEIQQRISQLETENAQLKASQEESDRRYAFDVLLMDSGVTDRDEREFLTYKYESMMKEKGETLELDENKHIKGAEGIVESLKTMRPKAFETTGKDGYQVLGDNRLPGSDGGNDAVTKEDFAKMGYKSRVELKANNPELYSKLTN